MKQDKSNFKADRMSLDTNREGFTQATASGLTSDR